ncbi:MAG: PorT family protein [Prolixibacteraceae bacterium]|nr:PorT family protein [Prolixibacteraceae bacterium]MBN2775312.1 PorT family protein [Prolixibacteraceae bacterium]
MKIKYLLIELILLFVISEVEAQEPGFIGGLLFNFNGIQVEGEKEQFWGSSNGQIWGAGGISAGAFVKHNFKKKLYGVFELRYIQKGSIYEFSNQYGNKALELLKLHYMEIPLLIGYNLSSIQKPVYLETGLAFSNRFNSKMAFNKLIERTNTPNADYFKNNDFSFIINCKFPINRKKNLLLGVRTEYSIFSIHEYYNLHNWDYGVEFNYLIFTR